MKLPSGRTITINCERCDTILNIKNRVDEREAIKPDAQRLIYGGKQLQDDKSLASYNIQPEATLSLVFRLVGGFTVFAQTMTGRVYKIQTSAQDTVENLMEKIEDVIGIPVEKQRLLSKGHDLWKTPDAKLSAFFICEGTVVHVIEYMPPCSCATGCAGEPAEMHSIQ